MEPLGFLAGTLMAISLLPQVLKSWKTKSTKDIAISWTLMNLLGQTLWVAFGIGVKSPSLVIMSGITLLMTLSLLMLKLRHG